MLSLAPSLLVDVNCAHHVSSLSPTLVISLIVSYARLILIAVYSHLLRESRGKGPEVVGRGQLLNAG